MSIELTDALNGLAAQLNTITGADALRADKVDNADVGAANGVASLDATGKVPVAQLPATASVSVVSTQAGANYIAALTDASHFIVFTSATGANFTIPPNSDVPFPVNTEIAVLQAAAGALTIVQGAGVTIQSAGGLELSGQYATAVLKKTAADTWVLTGDLAAGTGGTGGGGTFSATLDTDGTLAANSDSRVPSQKAVRTFVAAAVTGLLKYKGSLDCSASPNYPVAVAGDSYVVTVAGKIGGAAGAAVDAGDVVFATADNAGGTQAAVGANWAILEHNLAGVLLSANNLSDLPNVAMARSNLGLATIAASGSASDLTSGTVNPARLPDASPPNIVLQVSGAYFDTSPMSGLTNSAGTADRFQLHPWTPGRDITIQNIGVETTGTLVPGSQAKVTVYAQDPATYGPGALIKETGALVADANGYHGEAWAYTFKRGVTYWMGVRTSSTGQLRAMASNIMRSIGRRDSGSYSANVIQRTLAFATAATDPFGAIVPANDLPSAGGNGYTVVMQLA